jgi:hypothetical protein
MLTVSLIVPTRRRPAPLARLLGSLAATARRPEAVEVVLVVDADDPDSAAARHPALAVRPVVGPPGRTMGRLNQAGYEASRGDVVMLLNDDVVARTRGWDEAVRSCFRDCPDGVRLVHVNDTLMRRALCTFPAVSRRFCELAGGVCPEGYERYRIDDHVEDVFNLLTAAGVRRTVYLPEVVFEHTNGVAMPEGHREYHAGAAVLARDAPRFDALFPARKALAARLLRMICPEREGEWRAVLESLPGPMAPREAGRQLVRFPGRGAVGRAVGRLRLALAERWPAWRLRLRNVRARLGRSLGVLGRAVGDQESRHDGAEGGAGGQGDDRPRPEAQRGDAQGGRRRGPEQARAR